MSRIGKQLLDIPSGVQAKIEGSMVEIKGPKGSISRRLHKDMNIIQDGNTLRVEPKNNGKEDRDLKKFHGLTRSILNNMIIGVHAGFKRELTLIGVGYRAAVQGNSVNLTLGYSHPIVHSIPQGISVKVEKQTKIIIEGIDKEQVGQVAADIRSYRKPEPYHGKGVRYSDEVIVTKVGKAGGAKK